MTVYSSCIAVLPGHTESTDFPTVGALQTNLDSFQSAFVTELNANGNALVYSTYLGGGGSETAGRGIAIDAADNAYVTVETDSSTMPTTGGAFQTTYGGDPYDAYVAKLNFSGTALVYATYVGGSTSDNPSGIAVDSSGNAYVVGGSQGSNYPTTLGAFQTTYGGGTSNAFVTELNASGTALIYSTFLGGNGYDFGHGIAVDSSGNAIVTGWSTSTEFPITSGAFQTTLAGSQNAFVTKLNGNGSALVYSTFVGGSGADYAYDIAVDNSGN